MDFEEVHKAKNISTEMRHELLRKERFGLVTDEEMAQVSSIRYNQIQERCEHDR